VKGDGDVLERTREHKRKKSKEKKRPRKRRADKKEVRLTVIFLNFGVYRHFFLCSTWLLIVLRNR
jgi:hypothetical protein